MLKACHFGHLLSYMEDFSDLYLSKASTYLKIYSLSSHLVLSLSTNTYLLFYMIVGSMIAHKFKITNPQDYGLYQLDDGRGKGIIFFMNSSSTRSACLKTPQSSKQVQPCISMYLCFQKARKNSFTFLLFFLLILTLLPRQNSQSALSNKSFKAKFDT